MLRSLALLDEVEKRRLAQRLDVPFEQIESVAEAWVEAAVGGTLRGNGHLIDLLPAELREEARERSRARLHEAPPEVQFFSGTSGLPLRPTPAKGARLGRARPGGP